MIQVMAYFYMILPSDVKLLYFFKAYFEHSPKPPSLCICSSVLMSPSTL